MSDVSEKWGDAVAGRGFAQVPNYLLLINQFSETEKRLTAIELLVLIQLVGNWWKKTDRPFPSMGTLAARCNASSRQVQRAINKLEALGYVKRENRRTKGIIASNSYNLEPLAAHLGEIAKAYPNDFVRNTNGPVKKKGVVAHHDVENDFEA